MKSEAQLGLKLEALLQRASEVGRGSASWDALAKQYAEAAGITQKQAVRLFNERKDRR